MKKIHQQIAIAAALVCAACVTQGGTILSGTIYNDGFGGSSVDQWTVSVTTAGTVTFDVLAHESTGYYDPGTAIDLNGDGEITYLDSYLYLFDEFGDVVGSDDDGGLGSDGSINSYDSYLSLSLVAGNYTLAIGQYYLDPSEAGAGWNDSPVFGDYADYRITINGASVPGVPDSASTFALFGLALTGLVGLRRKLGE